MLIITGTQDSNNAAGVGKALSAYLKCLCIGEVPHIFVPTYVPGSLLGKFIPWIFAIPKIIVLLLKLKRSQRRVWLHPGSGISMFREGVIGLISRLLGARVCWHVHSLSTEKMQQTRYGRFLFRLFSFGSSEFIVLTPWWKNRLKECVANKQICIIPNPIELINNKFHKNKFKTDAIVVFSATRIVKGKGLNTLCESVKKLDINISIQIAGDGPEKNNLEQFVKTNNICDKVKFLGWLSQDEMNEAFAAADIFCLPTQNDSFGMVFIEAMKHGLPIIASNWQAIPDVVPDGEVGILVDPTDANEIAQAINKLADDADLRATYSANSLRVVKERYSIEAITPQLVNLFGEEDGGNP